MVNGWYMQRNPRIEPAKPWSPPVHNSRPTGNTKMELLGTTGELEGLLEESQNVNFKTPAGRGNVL